MSVPLRGAPGSSTLTGVARVAPAWSSNLTHSRPAYLCCLPACLSSWWCRAPPCSGLCWTCPPTSTRPHSWWVGEGGRELAVGGPHQTRLLAGLGPRRPLLLLLLTSSLRLGGLLVYLLLQLHRCVLGYMGDQAMAYPAQLGLDLVTQAQQQPQLRDEVFLQVGRDPGFDG